MKNVRKIFIDILIIAVVPAYPIILDDGQYKCQKRS
jgi:hypothetical protein